LVVVIAGKCRDKVRSKIIGNLIALFGLLEIPCFFTLAVTAAFVEAYIVFAVAMVVCFLAIL
jgi:hypothetical protein